MHKLLPHLIPVGLIFPNCEWIQIKMINKNVNKFINIITRIMRVTQLSEISKCYTQITWCMDYIVNPFAISYFKFNAYFNLRKYLV